ncbi:D-amino-acid transaminase [Ammoniphilus sp. CFH 90114]|uniref:D-amino-acid transaminase n=1 Tax=Ammoniphilus sp. CFH 90114 TaxID=2493665 RepID=UPI00100DC604|nr:D-amino-acid transaminase [Ammoniphilus sp. CFH 90114]RXT13656.1 D-amino-acid transaminase [Ammoniphilus sp. CFH 90114]
MILYNDRLVDREDVRIDIEDRGYQFGDGVYEVVSIYEGEIFRLQEHLTRFEYSANQIGITLPVTLEKLQDNLHKLIEHHQLSNGQIYFQVTRGYAPRNHPFPEESHPVLTGYVTRRPRPVESMKNGVAAIITEDLRWLRCDIKSLNLLGSVLAKQKAAEQGAFEAIQHRNGTVTEGSASNLFMVRDNKLYTHPLGNLILGGISRIVVLELAAKLNIEVIEAPFSLEELHQADELFLTSTTSEVMPIVTLDGKPVKNGTPGAVTKQLQEAFSALIGF